MESRTRTVTMGSVNANRAGRHTSSSFPVLSERQVSVINSSAFVCCSPRTGIYKVQKPAVSFCFRALRRDSGPEMAPTELEANCDLDVTIFLVEKSSTEDPAGSTSKKRRRTSAQDSESAQGATLGQVKVKARRLRQCSTYFDTCMSEKWAAQSQVPSEVEFHLEVHTEVRYYEDCFSRMNYLYKPIASVACCIELLKVASQIGFEALVDIGVKCLGGTTWSDEEEKLVAEFCTSAHLVPFDSLTDLLRARFEQQERLSSNVKDLFSGYLRNALPEKSLLGEAALKRQNSSRRRFAMTFHAVTSGVESGDVCDEVLEHVQAVLTEALANLLTRVRRELNYLPARASAVEGVLSDMCWLFEVAREANSTQALVLELLSEDLDDTARGLHFALFRADPCSLKGISQLKKWAAIIYAFFEDVLKGKLFLNSFQRSTLFWRWGWVLQDKVLGLDEKHVKAVRVRIITTLPQAEQEKFWMKVVIEPEQGIYREAYKMWISRMVTRKAQLLQAQSPASSNEVRSKTQD